MLYIKDGRLNDFLLTKNNFAVLMDFDKTMTTIDSDDSWIIIQNPSIVNPELNMKSNQLADKYRPIEMDYTLCPTVKSTHMHDWYHAALNLYYEYGLTYDNLLACVSYGNVVLRRGIKELLLDFYKNNIPVIILSAGIGNVIEQVLRLHGCLYDNIYIMSNFFTFKNNTLLPFTSPIIHTCNKSLELLPNSIKDQIANKPYFLLIGDFIEDIHMVPTKDLYRTLSFGFLEKNVDANLEIYKNSFDVVLTDHASFYDVGDIIRKVTPPHVQDALHMRYQS